MLDPAAKKTVLRQLTYGMYAITAVNDDDRGVFTANWLTQVSFDPPIVAASIELDSATLPLIRASGRFTVCPFTTDQRELAGNLGRPRQRVGDKFEAYDLPVLVTESGDLALANTLGYFVCQVTNEVAAGDSVVVLGEVILAGLLSEGEPLTMRAAGFRHAG